LLIKHYLINYDYRYLLHLSSWGILYLSYRGIIPSCS
jgi:hypothetical protein